MFVISVLIVVHGLHDQISPSSVLILSLVSCGIKTAATYRCPKGCMAILLLNSAPYIAGSLSLVCSFLVVFFLLGGYIISLFFLCWLSYPLFVCRSFWCFSLVIFLYVCRFFFFSFFLVYLLSFGIFLFLCFFILFFYFLYFWIFLFFIFFSLCLFDNDIPFFSLTFFINITR